MDSISLASLPSFHCFIHNLIEILSVHGYLPFFPTFPQLFPNFSHGFPWFPSASHSCPRPVRWPPPDTPPSPAEKLLGADAFEELLLLIAEAFQPRELQLDLLRRIWVFYVAKTMAKQEENFRDLFWLILLEHI